MNSVALVLHCDWWKYRSCALNIIESFEQPTNTGNFSKIIRGLLLNDVGEKSVVNFRYKILSAGRMLVLQWSREDVHNNDNNNVLSIQRRLLITMSANNEPPVKHRKQLSVLHFLNSNAQKRSVSTTRKNQVEGECSSSATDERTTANTEISCPSNDIGLVVVKMLPAEEKTKFLQPWQPQQEHE